MAFRTSEGEDFDTHAISRVLETTGTFGGLPLLSNVFQRGSALSALENWSRQQYCRPIDPRNDWELKDADERELSLPDLNFLEELLSVDRTNKSEEGGQCLSVDFEQQGESSKLVVPGDICCASELMGEFGCGMANETQRGTMANVERPRTGSSVFTSSRKNVSGESGYLKSGLVDSGALEDWAKLTSTAGSERESLREVLHDKYLGGKPEVLEERFDKGNDYEPTSTLKQSQETQPENQTLHPDNRQGSLDELEVFLTELSNSEASLCSSEEAEEIRHGVETMIWHVCDNLKSFRMFRNCTLLKTGSTYEGVKIGKPDEFDFMIVLPALAVDNVLQFSQNKYLMWHLAHYKVLNKEFFSDLFIEDAEGDDEVAVEGETAEDEFMAKVRDKVGTIIKEQLKNGQFLPAGWEFVEIPTIGAYSLPHMAVTPLMKWTGKEFKDLYISIDLSFAIPLNKKPLWTFGRQLFVKSCPTLSAPEKGNFDVLLPDCDSVSYVLLRDSKCCRFSFSCQEQEIMNSFDVRGGEKRSFRLVKFLRDSLIELTFDTDLQQLKSPISTYWLKTIMYYQLKKHENDPYAWVEGHLGSRVLEIFQVLRSCLISSKLHSFFIPGYNLLFLKSGEALASQVQEVIAILSDLKDGRVTRQQMRQQMAAKMKVHEDLLYEERRKHLINLFYIYAYNDYETEDLETIKTAFINRFFPGKMEVFGEGRNLRLHEAGCVVDIDAELEKMYGERFSYFN